MGTTQEWTGREINQEIALAKKIIRQQNRHRPLRPVFKGWRLVVPDGALYGSLILDYVDGDGDIRTHAIAI